MRIRSFVSPSVRILCMRICICACACICILKSLRISKNVVRNLCVYIRTLAAAGSHVDMYVRVHACVCACAYALARVRAVLA